MTNPKYSNNILTIDLSAIANNYRLFQNHVGENCQVAGIVKANAYGLGLQQVTSKLKELDCPQFFVATLDEAIELRKLHKKAPIAVLGGLTQKAEKDYFGNNITPVLNTFSDIERWQTLARKENKKLAAIMHFDTGMNRLGFNDTQTNELMEKDLKELDVQLIMSHFACADKKDHPLTAQQATNFSKIAKHFPNAKKSLANSSGLFRGSSYHYDVVRPGYALYGGNPTAESQNPMQTVVKLDTHILQISECNKGDTIGYGATHTFNQKTRTATVAIGYADGFLRSNSSKAVLYYQGQPCPVLGRVSMDLVSIDIGNIRNIHPKQGDSVEILGPHQSIDNLADTAGTIGYEILTSLGSRYKREYI